jgi:hypothetical protein
MDWDKLEGSYTESDSVKALLPIEFVMDYYNVTLHPQDKDGKRFLAVCPFHNDHDPSMSVYNKRYKCYTCSESGDVFDFIQKKESCGFEASLEKAATLLKQAREAQWVPSDDTDQAPPLESSEVSTLLEQTKTNSLEPLRQLIRARKWPVDADWVHQTFNVNCDANRVLIPFMGADGEWSGYKWRQGKEKYAGEGSRFGTYYAQWLDSGGPDVIVTEGEPDTWSVMRAVGKRYDVVGLPYGAGSPVLDPSYFKDRNVILAFDGDYAGRSGTRRWVGALNNVAASIRVVPIPDGFDISNLNDIEESIKSSHPVLPYTGNVTIKDGVFGYMDEHGKKSTFIAICNWSVTPERELRGEDGALAYEGYTSAGDKVVITADDLSSNSKVHYWATQQGLGWSGNEKQAHDILIWLEHEGPFISPGKMTSIIGLHEGNFVTPTRTFGKDRWVYLSKRGVDVSNLDYGYHKNWKDVLALLWELHDPAVMSVFLSWLAVAPARSLLKEFPGLAITGGSGIGKTTLIRTTTQAFAGGTLGGLDGISLVDTTKHPITEHMGATNGIPVWFDEYRPSVKWETRDAMHNAILAGFIGQTISKGSVMDNRGLGVSNWSFGAPFILSGENDLQETAHIERLIMLAIPEEGRNSKALSAIQEMLPSGIANVYLDWCINKLVLDDQITCEPLGHKDLPPRVRTSMGVLDLGWRMLGDFYTEYGMEMPLDEPDWSIIEKEAKRGADENPIIEAIRWAVESAATSQERIVITKEDYILLRVEPLVAEVNKTRRFPLPGNARAITRILLERFGGEEVVASFENLKLPNDTRFIKLKKSLIK